MVFRVHRAPSGTRLSEACFAIAPDFPGSGQSDLIPDPTFSRFGDLIEALLEKLGVVGVYLYVHGFGAPAELIVGFVRRGKKPS